MIEINRNPSPRELRWFGAMFLVFFGLVGGVILWRFHAFGVSTWIWSGAAALTLAYYAVAPLRRPIYVGWMYATYPLGWLFTHLVLAVLYYLLLTPIGLVMRGLGRDPMRRRFDSEASSYWIEHRPEADPARYFRQF